MMGNLSPEILPATYDYDDPVPALQFDEELSRAGWVVLVVLIGLLWLVLLAYGIARIPYTAGRWVGRAWSAWWLSRCRHTEHHHDRAVVDGRMVVGRRCQKCRAFMALIERSGHEHRIADRWRPSNAKDSKQHAQHHATPTGRGQSPTAGPRA